VADLNGDGCRDVIMATSYGSLVVWPGGQVFACEEPPREQDCDSEEGGMPRVFGDVAGVPAVGEVDGDGFLELAVHSEDGFVHLFDVTSLADCNVEWPMYGAGPRHDSVYPGQGMPRLLPSGERPRLSYSLQWSPNPTVAEATLSLTTPTGGALSVEVFDAAGRLVSRVDGKSPVHSGTHRVRWNAVDSGGRPLEPGVYFARVRVGSDQTDAKLILLR